MFLPTKGYCFFKCINFLTGREYKQQCLDFIRNEKGRCNIMTMARFHPFCKGNNFDIRFFDGVRVFPRSISEGNKSLYLYNNHFCLICKSQSVCFKKAIDELKANFKMVDNYKTQENVDAPFKYEFLPKK